LSAVRTRSCASPATDANEWVDLKFDKDLTGWETLRGKFRYQNNSTIAGRAESGDLAIRLLSPVGHRFEYRGEVTIPRLRFNTDNGGPLYCVSDFPVRRIRSFLIYPAPNRKEIAGRRDVIFGEAVSSDVLPGKNRLQVTVWDKTQTLRLNGTVVHTKDCSMRKRTSVNPNSSVWVRISATTGQTCSSVTCKYAN
jgi:hypothetical protein